MHFTLDEILKATGGQLTKPDARLPMPVIITGVSTDTRTLRDGDLFVPLRGPRADGHDFIADAFHRGAAAALSARPANGLPSGAVLIRVDDPLRALGRIARAYRRTLTVTVVGVTGSVGKTTTTKLCAAVLGRAFAVASTKEVWNAEIGVPLTLLGLTVEHGVAVIEMAMRGLGQIAELVEMAAPSIGVVTSISDAHLEHLGSRGAAQGRECARRGRRRAGVGDGSRRHCCRDGWVDAPGDAPAAGADGRHSRDQRCLQLEPLFSPRGARCSRGSWPGAPAGRGAGGDERTGRPVTRAAPGRWT